MANLDPFDPAVADEADELRSLTQAIRLSQGFALLLVRCNDPQQRREIEEHLHQDLPDYTFQSLNFREPIRNLLDTLRVNLPAQPPDAVLISGLEYSLPDSKNAAQTPLIANLNAARNSFPHVVPCPLVLFVPEYVLVAMMHGAPDFYSVRSGLYFFARTPAKSGELRSSLLAGEERQLGNLTAAEKATRVQEIKSLLADYRALANQHRSKAAEHSLLNRLGNLYLALGHWSQAEFEFLSALKLALQRGDYAGEGKTLNNLGIVYRLQGKWSEAEKVSKDSLTIKHDLGDRFGEGQTLMNLGVVYRSQGKWSEAENVYGDSLTIFREFGDQLEAGKALNNLGVVHQMKGEWNEAEKAYKDSLTIFRKFGDQWDEGKTLHNLGEVYSSQSKWSQAEKMYQDRLTISRNLGDCVGEGKTLANLALLEEAQENWERALLYTQRAVEVLETTQAQRELEQARETLTRIEAKIAGNSNGKADIPTSIP